MIEIETPDGTAEAYVARPESGAVGPGVLLYMDAIGLRPQIERMADRIASWGYVVLAPNVFYRHGSAAEIAPKTDLREPGAREAFLATVVPFMRAHTPDQSARDLDAYADALRSLTEPHETRWAAIGYCMGGRLALRAGAQFPSQVAAVGMFHVGGLVTDDDDSPHLCIPDVRAEVLARYADNDGSMPKEAIATVDEALARSGVSHSTAIYEGAQHGYTMADTPMYGADAAERHFDELKDLLARTLLNSASSNL